MINLNFIMIEKKVNNIYSAVSKKYKNNYSRTFLKNDYWIIEDKIWSVLFGIFGTIKDDLERATDRSNEITDFMFRMEVQKHFLKNRRNNVSTFIKNL